MAWVGMLYNPRGAASTLERRLSSTPHQVRYLSGFYELDDLGRELRRQAAQIGWHAQEHLVELEHALFDAGSEAGTAWLDERCHQLKHEGGAAVLEDGRRSLGSRSLAGAWGTRGKQAWERGPPAQDWNQAIRRGSMGCGSTRRG